MNTWEASYAGQCATCLGWFKEGATIQRVGDHYGHAKCPTDPEPRPICPVHFLEVPVTDTCPECE